MRKIQKFAGFDYLRQGKLRQQQNQILSTDSQVRNFETLVKEGREVDVVKSVVQKNAMYNENYNLILENEDTMAEVKHECCRVGMLEGINDLKVKVRDYYYRTNFNL